MRDPPPTPAQALVAARRLVVKIGSALLAAEDGEVRRPWLGGLADDVARFRSRGQEVILVSSGAIAVGRRHLGLSGRRLRLEEKQAAAATGQIRLAHAYQEALAATSTAQEPWYVIPADHKWFAHVLIAEIILETLEDLDLAFPKLTSSQRRELRGARRRLIREG